MVYAFVTFRQASSPTTLHNAPVYTVAIHPRALIEQLRSDRGFKTVAALAKAAGIPQPTLSRYLSGRHASMHPEHWVSLAGALGVTVSELLGETPISTRWVREINGLLVEMSEEDRERVALMLRALTHRL